MHIIFKKHARKFSNLNLVDIVKYLTDIPQIEFVNFSTKVFNLNQAIFIAINYIIHKILYHQ